MLGVKSKLFDALSKLGSIYSVVFEGKAYDVGNRLEWLKTSIDFARDDKESKEGLIEYMEIFIKN